MLSLLSSVFYLLIISDENAEADSKLVVGGWHFWFVSYSSVEFGDTLLLIFGDGLIDWFLTSKKLN